MALPVAASADALDIAQYRARLVEVRSLVDRSRTVAAADRQRMLGDAATLLRVTTALRTRHEPVAVDDGAIADMLTGPDGANRALPIIDAYIASADRVLASRIDAAVADQRLREAVGATETTGAAGAGLGPFFAYLQSRLASFIAGLQGPMPDLRLIPFVIAAFGLGLVAIIVAILGRGVRERIRREVLLPQRADRRADDPSEHLQRADAALAAGNAREAIHQLFLYVIGVLVAREALRYEPALTDRELLARAAAIPHADALGDLVLLYERAWFGLREPDAGEAARARALATRVAG
jgi:hypothetical protein